MNVHRYLTDGFSGYCTLSINRPFWREKATRYLTQETREELLLRTVTEITRRYYELADEVVSVVSILLLNTLWGLSISTIHEWAFRLRFSIDKIRIETLVNSFNSIICQKAHIVSIYYWFRYISSFCSKRLIVVIFYRREEQKRAGAASGVSDDNDKMCMQLFLDTQVTHIMLYCVKYNFFFEHLVKYKLKIWKYETWKEV